MAAMRFDAERIMDELYTLLSVNLPAALDTVEARWTADPYTLPDPQTYHKGFTMMVVELPSTSFPYITIMVPTMDPRQTGRPHLASVQYTAVLQGWIVADTEAHVKQVAYRYVEAICDVLQTQKVIAGYVQSTPLPKVEMSESAWHLKEGTTGDISNEADIDYLRVVEITLTLEGE